MLICQYILVPCYQPKMESARFLQFLNDTGNLLPRTVAWGSFFKITYYIILPDAIFHFLFAIIGEVHYKHWNKHSTWNKTFQEFIHKCCQSTFCHFPLSWWIKFRIGYVVRTMRFVSKSLWKWGNIHWYQQKHDKVCNTYMWPSTRRHRNHNQD